MAREQTIARSIVKAITNDDRREARSAFKKLISAIAAFFALYALVLVRYRNDLFHSLRTETWIIDETAYERTFDDEDKLETTGDMGYSGSVSLEEI